MKKILVLISMVIALLGCAKDEITIYNDYGGNSSDSTGYYNIFYHDFEPDISITPSNSNITGNPYFIDFNNDDEPDFAIRSSSNNKISIVSYGKFLINNQCEDTSIYDNVLIANLDTGYMIQSIYDWNDFTWHSTGGGSPNSGFFELGGCTNLNGTIFLGMNSSANTTNSILTHNNYGWMRLEVFNGGDSILIKDYAYNLIENSPIRVGDK